MLPLRSTEGNPLFIDTYEIKRGFPGGHSRKELAFQCRRRKRSRFDPWVRKIPWRRKWRPTPVLLNGKFRGWRSLVGYSPWDCKESDMTEQLHWSTGCTMLQNISTVSQKVVPNILRQIVTKFLRFKSEQRESNVFIVTQHFESNNAVMTFGLQLTKQII